MNVLIHRHIEVWFMFRQTAWQKNELKMWRNKSTNKKRVEVFCFVSLTHLIFNIHSLSSLTVIISRFFHSRADVRHSQTTQRIFRNQWMPLIVQFLKGNDFVCCAFRFNSLYFFHSFISETFFSFLFHFYNRFSKTHNTAHVPIDRHSFWPALVNCLHLVFCVRLLNDKSAEIKLNTNMLFS